MCWFWKRKEKDTNQNEMQQTTSEQQTPEQMTPEEEQMRIVIQSFAMIAADAEECKKTGNEEKLQRLQGVYEAMAQKGMTLNVSDESRGAFTEKMTHTSSKLQEAVNWQKDAAKASGKAQMRLVRKYLDEIGAQADQCERVADEETVRQLYSVHEATMKKGKGLNVSEEDKALFETMQEIVKQKVVDADARVKNAVEQSEHEQMQAVMEGLEQIIGKADTCKEIKDKKELDNLFELYDKLEKKGKGINVTQARKVEFGNKKDETIAKLKEAKTRIKKDTAIQILKKAKGTSLEKLIAKVKGMNNVSGIRPQGTEVTTKAEQESDKKMGSWTAMGKEVKSLPGEAVDSIKEAFSGPKEFFETFTDKFDNASGLFATSVDLDDSIGGTGEEEAAKLEGKKLFEYSEPEKGTKTEEDIMFAKMLCSTLSAALHLIRLLLSFHELKKKEQDQDTFLDDQERNKVDRSIFRQIVQLFGDFIGAGGKYIDGVPLLGPALNFIQGGFMMAVDSLDIATDSDHKEMMSRERELIYKRIQAKKAKYSKESEPGKKVDAAAADAYTIDEKWYRSRATDVDHKRKEMLKTVALGSQNASGQANKIRIIREEDLRSRNDSMYREAAYGLGQRIREKKIARPSVQPPGANAQPGSKTELRQMEALEMMEKYREAEKAHKKMRKSIGLKVEALIRGGEGLLSSGLKLVGQIMVLTGAGASAGAGALSASLGLDVVAGGYDLGRTAVAGIYHGARKIWGAETNKDTTRNDMAIAIIERMQEVGNSEVWEGQSFVDVEDDNKLANLNQKDLYRQGENVRQLRVLLRGGLDASMSDLIKSESAEKLKERLADSFGQG